MHRVSPVGEGSYSQSLSCAVFFLLSLFHQFFSYVIVHRNLKPVILITPDALYTLFVLHTNTHSAVFRTQSLNPTLMVFV